MNQIFLASDGSPNALNATKEVIKLGAGFSEMQVTVITVIDTSEIKSAALDLKLDKDLLRLKHLKKIENTLGLLREADISHQVEILQGDPAERISQYISEHPADMLVLGSRGLNTIQEIVLGSVSHKLIKQADCPVLVVKR
ncbi:universal stress protein [Listeria riparia]|uniref:Universal stress protein n=1 Tax=Listeria riparia FSL S10-1204 TaxID=1265816 RepID=W7DA21_9LIST|nr:universal stress protein [Listeria riparia]EUJ46112.1 Universal stress protein [Listeria riparia FSL S10-1204]